MGNIEQDRRRARVVHVGPGVVDVEPTDGAAAAPRPAAGGGERRLGRRWLLLLCTAAATAIVLGVLLQAFSIAAYVRGAGTEALRLHELGGFLVHAVEILVLLAAVGAFWGAWRLLAAPVALVLVGTAQVGAIGDTDERGGWINGLHGALALVVLLLALAVARDGMQALADRRAARGPFTHEGEGGTR